MILMIINLVVITKGAGRVSEVSARFTLDAMPGKQMAIDADLNAGLLTPEEAKARRQEVATEADFYGSMDGASKFVKGDAIAGVLILVVNIIGGLILGTLSHGLSLGDAASTYVLLAIGDALVAQVPALLLSIAAASIVTRVSSPLDLSGQIASQFGSARAWTPVAAILALPRPAARHAAPDHPARRRRSPASSPGSCARPPGRAKPTPPPSRRPSPSPSVDRLGRGQRRRRARPRARLRPGRPGRRAQGRAADGADHRHPPPALARARLRRAAGAGPRRARRWRPTATASPSPASSSARTRSGPTTCSRSTAATCSSRIEGRAGQGPDLRPRRGLDRAGAARRGGRRRLYRGRSGDRRRHPSQPDRPDRRRRPVRHGRGAEAARRAQGKRAAARRRT